MARKYFVWKNSACMGKDVEWLEITGPEFFEITKHCAETHRCFIRLNAEPGSGDDTLFFEVTQEQYIEWRKEYDARRWRAAAERLRTILSMDFSLGDADVDTLHELVGDPQVDVEREALSSVLQDHIAAAVKLLDDEDAKILTDRFVKERTTVELAEEMGITKQAVSKRVAKALANLKKYF